MRTLIDITFVIPVYNAEKFLAECLESVLRQNASKEVICINDGSTDQSLSILKEYASKYPEIRIIDKENEGVSKARNRGIEQAKGRYLWFVDADDKLLVQDMSALIQIADEYQLDLIRGAIIQEREDKKHYVLRTASDKVMQEYLAKKNYTERISNTDYLLQSIHHGFSPKITSGFYRTTFLRDNHCYFPNNRISNAEDEYFEIKALSNSLDIKIFEFSMPFYFYRYNNSSSTKSQVNQFKGSLLAFELMLELCNQLEEKILQLPLDNPDYVNLQKLLWAVRFITLRLNIQMCLFLFLDFNKTEQNQEKHLIKAEHIHYLDEFKYMILACNKGSQYAFLYKETHHRIVEFKKLFDFH